ncbi:MAG: type I restriction endonuclease subunit R [Deltaproteobacteria bacterium]|nr:type I restriction endonuclease subunit R [Deltaproteobacteria bacterium]
MANINEDILEQTTLDWFESLGWQTAFGPDLAFDGAHPERKAEAQYSDVILEDRLQTALHDINPNIPQIALDDALRKIIRTESPSLIENNRRFHRFLTDGIDVSFMDNGREVFDKVWLLDLADLENNDWLVVNQFTVVENRINRRPDLVVFVNGLPLAVVELKNPADEKATLRQAFNQFQTYKQDIPALFTYNELLVISDGLEARCGSITSGWDRFMPWRTVDGMEVAPKGSVELEVLINGIFDKRRLLDLILNFIVFEDDGSSILKKIAAYHQYHAVNKAVECTLSACGVDAKPMQLYADFPRHDELNPFGLGELIVRPYGKNSTHFGGRRIGVIWHTQGSGKSLSMAFLAGKVIRHPAMKNPTIVVITDRNDLDDQLFGTFSRCRDLMRQTPVQAESRPNLRTLLNVPAGGVVFTTIQKFMPEEKGDRYPMLSDRENIVVIADEAHRSQYDFIDGYARHMHDALPKASFIGFTATPIERDDRSTPAVFGDYIDTYDMLRSIEDKATVPIYYEGRLAKIELDKDEWPAIDPEFEEITEGEEETAKQRLRTKWAALEAMVGTEKRIGLVAEDLVRHAGERQSAMKGKVLIVCMSRRICVDMYNAIVKLRPEWHGGDDDKGIVKIVMSGAASDSLEWQPHIRNKARRETLAKRFKDPEDHLAVVIVRDMWLTGFDCPSMHTMYVDKPMRGHGLMQAIARVNRVFKDKPGGLVVDYIGLAYQLKRALADYTEAGGRGKATFDQEEAVQVMLEKYDIVVTMYHGFDYISLMNATPAQRLAGIAAAMEHIFQIEEGKTRYLESVTALSKAFALAVPHEEALKIRDEVGFFQEVRSALAKATVEGEGKTQEEMDTAIQQLVSRAVISDEVVDIFASVGLKKPDISILSDEFLEEVRQLPHKNLAVEVLRKLLNDEIKARSRKNVVQARSFSEMLEEAIIKYQNRAIEAAQVIEELIGLAKEMQKAQRRGEELNLNEDEVAFYDALEVNDSAVKVLGDDTLKNIAHELVSAVRRNVSIDWTVRENARANIRVIVKRILRKYGYPPDKQEKATQTVLEQAEVLCSEWASK